MQQYSFQQLLFLILLLSSTCSYSQDYLFKTEEISVEDGLSNRFVRSILQDSKGFMWFATQYGLNRYDGYQFQVLTKEENGLQSNFIDKIYLDADSNLWVGHSINNRFSGRFSGIDLVNANTFEVQRIEEKIKTTLPFKINELYEIVPDLSNNWLYLLTTTGEIYIYKGQQDFELFYEHDKKVTIHGFKIGNLYDWIYCGDEVVALDKKKQIVNRVVVESSLLMNISDLITSTNNTIWLVSYNSILKKHPSIWSWNVNGALRKHTTFYFLSDSIVIYPYSNYVQEDLLHCSIYSDRNNLRIYNPNKECIYAEQFDSKTALRDLYIDRQSNIWIAKSSKGILKISYQENKFQPHLTSKTVRAITTIREDSFLFANQITKAEIENLHTTETQSIKALGRSLYKTLDEKYIWVGTVEAELKKINAKSLEEEATYTYPVKENPIKEGMKIGWAVHKDEQGCIWLGTSRGLAYLDKGMDSLQVYTSNTTYKALENSIITHFYENDKGLWIATSQGLYLMNGAKEIEQGYCKKNAPPFQLPHEYILHIHEDKQGVFWLSTRGGGVVRLDLKTGNYQQFTTREGLSHNVVYAILEDEQHNFWMSSDYGLMRFNPQSHIVNTYLPNDGILHEEFNHPSAYKTSDGTLYFGGISGVVKFTPSDFYTKEESNSPLVIVNYQCFNSEKGVLENQTQTLIHQQKMVLNHTDRFFVLSFALLDYKSGYKKHYAYQIEGLDKEWNFIESNSIRINGLTAGNYVLKIKGQGNNGIWSSSYLEIPILVKQPFYRTFIFIASVLFMFVLLLVVYFRWRVIRLRKAKAFLEEEVQKRTEKIAQQADELRALDDVKSRFFANISHELRTPLTLITGPVNAILERYYGTDWQKVDQALEVVKRNGNQLEKLIEEILLLSKLEANNIVPELKNVLFFPFVQALFKAFEAEAELKDITYQLDYQLDKDLFLLLDENKLEKIINNLLSNAFKYTSTGTIEFIVQATRSKKEATALELIIVDSGKGIHPKDLPYIFDRYYQSKDKAASIEGGVGIGLALAAEFAEVLGGKLSVESTLGQGSVFKLQLKVDRLELPNGMETIAEAELAPTKKLTTTTAGIKKASILIVEDNIDMRSFVADLLSPHYQTHLAENGKKALAVLEQDLGIDLIVSDVMMPEMDGFEFLQQVKEHIRWRKLPMIMLTARTAEKDKLTALRIGVDDYLTKPFSHQELLVRIKNLLQNYRERILVQKETEVFKEVSIPSEELPIKGIWLKKLEELVLKEIGNRQLTVTRLAADLYISERQLRRRIKAQTGLTPHRYFTLMKLEVARQYLEGKEYETVAEVAHKVGFLNISHFSKIYAEQYGKRPSTYLKL